MNGRGLVHGLWPIYLVILTNQIIDVKLNMCLFTVGYLGWAGLTCHANKVKTGISQTEIQRVTIHARWRYYQNIGHIRSISTWHLLYLWTYIPMFEYVIHICIYIYRHIYIHTAFVCFLFHTLCDTWPELITHEQIADWKINVHMFHMCHPFLWHDFRTLPCLPCCFGYSNHWTTSRYPWVNRLLRAVVDAECCSVLVWCSIPEYCSIPAIGAHICNRYIYTYIVQYSIYVIYIYILSDFQFK